MVKSIIFSGLALFPLILAINGCRDDSVIVKEEPQKEPTGVYFERLNETIVRINWRDGSETETGYSVYLLSEGQDHPEKIGETQADETSFAITSDLVSGNMYYIGVRTDAEDEENSSRIVYVPMKMIPVSSVPTGVVTSKAETQSCLSVTYSLRGYENLDNIETGLCWSAEGKAVRDDNHLAGPSLPSNGTVLQIISNQFLDYGVSYDVRSYIKSDEGVFYIDAGEMTLKDEPQPVKFSWNKVTVSNIPESISVYETNDKLDGRSFHAFYAVANLKGTGIELRSNVPASVTTIDDQAASFDGDCYVLVNGGYFASGQHTGIAVNDFVVTGSINNPRGSILAADAENSVIYPAGKAFFGVDDFGDPSVYWANGSGVSVSYFSKPVPSVKGEAKYPMTPSAWASADVVEWLPRAGISAAPVLLKDGKRPFDFTNTPRGESYYYTNFEFVATDIFGPDSICDRTSIGSMEDGSVVLLICDGRMSSSPGADLMELAMIMKGLGCVQAINLDGGGSTGMMVGDKRFGDTTVDGNRKVMSTVGFFRRK